MSSVTESPYKKATDSPSRQLLWELAQLHLNDRTSFYAKLEEDARDRENQHRAALAAAAAEHDRIRQRAEIERERLQIQMDKEIARREARQRKLLDTQKRLTAEKSLKEEQKALARAQALEDENRKIAEIAKAKVEAQRKAQEAQAEIDAAKKAQQDQEDAARAAARKAVEDAQRRKREEATKSAAQSALLSSSTIATIPTAPAATNLPRTQNSIQPTRVPGFAPPAGKQATSSIGSLTGHLKPERVAEHDRYLDIHKNLKVLRKAVAEEGKSNKSFKTAIGDSRRTIRKCVGQITDVKGANQKPVDEIRNILTSAAQFSEPSVPVSQFLARPPNNLPPGIPTNISVALIYLLNILSKSFLAQCTNDLAVSQHSADPLGILVMTIFSDKAFQYLNSISLIDILLAKFHASCPVLFGIYPPPAGPSSNLSTDAKRWLLGWRVEDKMLVSEQAHSDRMTGIATGFAAIALRKFRSATKKNAYPPHNYWRALATMVNTPTEMLTPTHFLVLKNMIESQEKRIVEYFGHAGIVLMRQALLETPMRGAARVDGPARRACMVLVDVIEKDRGIVLREY